MNIFYEEKIRNKNYLNEKVDVSCKDPVKFSQINRNHLEKSKVVQRILLQRLTIYTEKSGGKALMGTTFCHYKTENLQIS